MGRPTGEIDETTEECHDFRSTMVLAGERVVAGNTPDHIFRKQLCQRVQVTVSKRLVALTNQRVMWVHDIASLLVKCIGIEREALARRLGRGS